MRKIEDHYPRTHSHLPESLGESTLLVSSGRGGADEVRCWRALRQGRPPARHLGEPPTSSRRWDSGFPCVEDEETGAGHWVTCLRSHSSNQDHLLMFLRRKLSLCSRRHSVVVPQDDGFPWRPKRRLQECPQLDPSCSRGGSGRKTRVGSSSIALLTRWALSRAPGWTVSSSSQAPEQSCPSPFCKGTREGLKG